MSKKIPVKKIELKGFSMIDKKNFEKIYSPHSKSPKKIQIRPQFLKANNFLKRRERLKNPKSNEPSLLPTQQSATPKGLENKRIRNLSLSNNPIKRVDTGHLRKFSVPSTQTFITKSHCISQTGYIPDFPQKENQDAYIEILNSELSLFGVFDGHGVNGGQISTFIKSRLPSLLTKSPHLTDSLLSSSIQSLNEEIEKKFDSSFSGSTLTLVSIQGKKLLCANVGDSRAIIGNQINDLSPNTSSGRSWVAVALSRDHKPDLNDEFDRITSSGGRVLAYSDENGQPTGPARVWLKDQNIPGLAMSRSLGDGVAKTVGVTSEAEILKYDLNAQDKFLVVASDGAFEFLSNEDVVKLVVPYWKSGNPAAACRAVVNAAEYCWKTVRGM
jgi:serine/threonine protein phosphatase PrpC